MTDPIKSLLSAGELELVCNKEWILAKKNVVDKVYLLFGALAQRMQLQVQTQSALLPAAVTQSSPKISRGENYRGLPYILLDYPRHFTSGDTVAIRTLFWWGNFFSINLHLSGTCKEKAMPLLEHNFDSLQQKGYYLCVHPHPWEHHYEQDNFRPLKEFTAAEFAGRLQQMDFVKIALPISLTQWEKVPAFVEKHFIEMMQLLKINFPSDETDPLPGIPTADSGL
jgi:hypothetical protein